MTIRIYDKAQDLGSIIFKVSDDKERALFDKNIEVLKSEGIVVESYDAFHHPDKCANKRLPEINVGAVVYEGRYPSSSELAQALNLDANIFAGNASLVYEANHTRLGECCGVGSDIYLDPNEE